MAPSTTASISEHWLTLMTCIVCERTPDESPVYQCNLGHIVCLNCFKEMTKHGVLHCTCCKTTKFEVKPVSNDFLKKLKSKPGIGRPFRYVTRSRSQSPPPKQTEVIEKKEESITMEKLFHLPQYLIDQLFKDNGKKKVSTKIENDFEILITNCRCCQQSKRWQLYKQGNSNWFVERYQENPSLQRISSNTTIVGSKKPVTCPHDHCNKVITMSAFHTHFKHEHSDIPRYSILRGKELEISFNPLVLEYNKTFCLGIVTVYEGKIDEKPPNFKSVRTIFNQRITVDTFWIMVSGSNEMKKSEAYILFWLFTNNDEFYNCTIEVAPPESEICFSTFCAVNGMYDSMDIKGVAERLNCLYVAFGGMESILSYGAKATLRVSVH